MSRISYIKTLGKDIPSSIVVFLVALPLCLGIALASGAPPISGLLAGIVGGIVVGSLSGSHTSVSGPAAGLAAVVLGAITQLGAFETFLLAVVLAGFLQIVMGIAKAGFIANYFPTSVIKGLLAAIGIILILKQIPHALGYDKDAEGDFSFFQRDGENTFSELWAMLGNITPAAVLISLVSLAILIVWEKTRLKKSLVPAPLVVVVLGVVMSEFLLNGKLSPEHLVNIPVSDGVANFFSSFTMPDWSQFTNKDVYIVAGTLAIVASLETLLNLEAVDKLDTHRRYSPPNRELFAQGVGNSLSGLIGGLPVTSVIVRSSANINANAATKLSAILHGIFLFVCVLAIPGLLNKIPLSTLAAILLVTGYKLASIKMMRGIWQKGLNQFMPFAITVVAIVFTDLLIGILIGLCIGVFYVLKANYKNPFRERHEVYTSGEVLRLKLSQEASFLNRGALMVRLNEIEEGSEVILDATDTEFIDHDILEIIREFRDVKAPEKNIKLTMMGFREKYSLDDHVQWVNVLTKEKQEKLLPSEVLQILKEGNQRFVRNETLERDYAMQAGYTADSQHPMAVVLSCIDSRTTAEVIFDLGLGDIFSIRLAGNVANSDIIGSMEFATHVAGAKLICVLGHTNCGAVKAACDRVQLGNLTGLLEKVKPALDRETETTAVRNSGNPIFVQNVTRLNVAETMKRIVTSSDIISSLLQEEKIMIVGGVYDLNTRKVEFLEIE